MNLKKAAKTILNSTAKSFSGFKGWTAVKTPFTMLESFKQAPGLKREVNVMANLPRFDFNKMLKNIRLTGRVTGNIVGATVGGVFGSMTGPGGAAVGAATGGLIGGFGIMGASKFAKTAVRMGFNYPKTTAALTLTGMGAYTFMKPILSPALTIPNLNRPTNPALPNSTIGPGYLTMGNSPRIRMPANNIGATGSLVFAQHRLRHGR